MEGGNGAEATPPLTKAERRLGHAQRVGVVDIGSNTVRLVVFETPTRLPIPIFNEKVQCGLGTAIAETHRLSPAGVEEALRSLARFARLAAAMSVAHLEIVATAAVRDAEDGPDFVARVEAVCGLPVHVLSGAEEARLAAVGLLRGVPEADGVLGDFGGGSLDLVALDAGVIGAFATLSIGHLRLLEQSAGDRDRARRIVDEALSEAPWLHALSGRTFYAVGGSWRALARVFLDQTHHPLHVLDNYSVSLFDALKIANLVSGLSDSTLEGLRGVARGRLATLPYAAAAMSSVLESMRPARVVFSGFGMREGQMLEMLPPALRQQDPLISACESHAERTGRFAMHGDEILEWISPLFAAETAAQRRLRLATCLVSDIGWSEHPDYRAIHAFQRVLRVPYAGLTHFERAEMALAVYVRYNGDVSDADVAPIRNFIDEPRLDRSIALGLALRLAHTISGGAPGLLPQTQFQIERDRLILVLPADSAVFVSDAVERRFRTLARALRLKPKLVTL